MRHSELPNCATSTAALTPPMPSPPQYRCAGLCPKCFGGGTPEVSVRLCGPRSRHKRCQRRRRRTIYRIFKNGAEKTFAAPQASGSRNQRLRLRVPFRSPDDEVAWPSFARCVGQEFCFDRHPSSRAPAHPPIALDPRSARANGRGRPLSTARLIRDHHTGRCWRR